MGLVSDVKLAQGQQLTYKSIDAPILRQNLVKGGYWGQEYYG